jgi:ABC-type transporter Mla subunit MlaD
MGPGRASPVVALASALALLAGCGGDDDASATETWANGVCTAFVDWQESVQAATSSLEGEEPAGERLEAAVDDLGAATRTLRDDLRGLGPPDTDVGQQAREVTTSLADELADDVEEIEQAAAGAEGVSETLTAVSTISATLVAMGEAASTAFEELERLDSSGELEAAFESADACGDLQGREE